MSLSTSRRTESALVLLILVVAAVLRLGWPGLTEFKADEARLLALALDMAQGGQFALRGISSSVGFPNFPMSVWVYAMPLLVWPHVYAATLFTGLLNVLALLGCYWFVRRYWGVGAAMAATIMLAVSPWAIVFSRKIWAQNLLPPFVMMWAISAALAFVERRPKFIWLHFLALAIAVQIHLAAVVLVPATVIFLIVFRRRVEWKMALLGVGLAALTAVPFAVYLWRNTGQVNLAQRLGQATASQVDLDSFRYTWMIGLGVDIHSLAGPQAFADYLARIPAMSPVYWLWGALILAGTAWLAWRVWRRWRGRAQAEVQPAETGLIVLLWLWLPPLFFVWHSTPVFLHYFVAVLPAPTIVAGVAFSRVLHWLPHLFRQRQTTLRVTQGAGWALLLATAAAQLWAWAVLLALLGSRATPGGFGVPVAMRLQAVERARTMLATTGAEEVLVVSEGDSPAVDEQPAIYDTLLRQVPHRFVDIDRSALFPGTPVVVLLEEDDGRHNNVTGLYLEAYQAGGESVPPGQQVRLREEEGVLRVLALPGEAAPAPDLAFDEPYLLANWVSLFGYDEPVIREDETAVWRIHWRPGDNPDPASYHFFNHLLDKQGNRVAQADAAAFSPQQWQQGDTVISRFILPWPREADPPFTMRVGMYTYPALEPVLLLDVAGNPYTDAAEIKLPSAEIGG